MTGMFIKSGKQQLRHLLPGTLAMLVVAKTLPGTDPRASGSASSTSAGLRLRAAKSNLASAHHALPHLDLSALDGGRAAGVVCPPAHPVMDSLAFDRFLHFLRLVES